MLTRLDITLSAMLLKVSPQSGQVRKSDNWLTTQVSLTLILERIKMTKL